MALVGLNMKNSKVKKVFDEENKTIKKKMYKEKIIIFKNVKLNFNIINKWIK